MACCVTVKTSVISLVSLIIVHAVVNKYSVLNFQTQVFLLVNDCTSFSEIKNLITALFKNTQTVKFKSQLTFAFVTTVNHLSGPLRKQKFTSAGSKGHGLGSVIGGFRSVLCFCISRFIACDRYYD